MTAARAHGFVEQVHGYFRAIAVGDAIGGATETFSPQQIIATFGGPVEGVVAAMPPATTRHHLSLNAKGDGRITDDTLLTVALAEVYCEKRDHLDVYDIDSRLVPKLADELRWIPERDQHLPLIERLHYPEKWLVARLRFGGVDPRDAGVGNVVNCGAAMCIGPVGIVNAGEPEAAYGEAIEVTAAHQSSYGREAAGVLAAATAAALAPKATVDTVIGTAIAMAHDGTEASIIAVDAVAQAVDPADAPAAIRAAVAPFDSVGDDYLAPRPDARRPSRALSIEELPVALGILRVTSADPRAAILMAANYGRDADSIAVMAGGIAGILSGPDAVPQDWVDAVEAASRLDLGELAAGLSEAAMEIMRNDAERARSRADRLVTVTSGSSCTAHRVAHNTHLQEDR